MKYVHTNIIAKNLKLLSEFYIKVFDCKPVLPERDINGDWLEKGTGVKNASLHGIHLLLPGFDNDGPTLEIFQYHENENKPNPVANREGFGHIAFLVPDVDDILNKMISHGIDYSLQDYDYIEAYPGKGESPRAHSPMLAAG
jgi:lactoylglutathione lyase